MVDQAEALRNKVRKLQESSTRVIGILSGKGGVGKSVFAVNFALALHRHGKKTLLIDLDIGMANVDILLNLYTAYHFVDMIDKRLPIESVIAQHPSGLSIISGGSGLSHLFNLDEESFRFFLEQFAHLKRMYEYVIFDLPAGFNADTHRFLSAVHEVILVTTTEPTSLADGYAAIKLMTKNHIDVPIFCVINRYDSLQEAKRIWFNLEHATARFLGKTLTLLGTLPRDRAVVQAVKNQKPFLTGDPKAKVSIGLEALTKKYLQQEAYQAPPSFDSFIHRLKSLFRSKG